MGFQFCLQNNRLKRKGKGGNSQLTITIIEKNIPFYFGLPSNTQILGK